MAVAEVDIVNRALIKIGSKTIMSLGDDVKSARAASKIYPMVRDRCLVAFPWNFAMKRAQRTNTTAVPVYGYRYLYAFPADALRIWDIEGGEVFKVEGRSILTDAPPPINFRYIAQIADTSFFPPQFSDYLAAQLASELSYYLAVSAELSQKALADAESQRPPSYLVDAQEGTPEPFPDGSWLASRH